MEKLSLERISSDKLSVQTFASKERKKIKAPLVQINLLCEKEEKISLKVSVIPLITTPIIRLPLDTLQNSFLKD